MKIPDNIRAKLDVMEAELKKLTDNLTDPKIAANLKKLEPLTNKIAEVGEKVAPYLELKALEEQLNQAQAKATAMGKDAADKLKPHIDAIQKRIDELVAQVKSAMSKPASPNDQRDSQD